MNLVGTFCLTNSFSDGSVLSTSDDGQIAVTSDSGVHTLLYNSSPLHQQLTFHIQIMKIDAVNEIFRPVSDFDSNDCLLFDSAAEFTLDHTIASCRKYIGRKSGLNTTDIGDKSKKVDSETPRTKADQRGARQARWSPRNADVVGSCLLAVLWFDHRLIVYGNFKKDCLWHRIADISELWKEKAIHWLKKQRRKPKSVNKEGKLSTQQEKLRDDCYARAAVAIVWSPLYEQLDFDKVEDPDEPLAKQQPSTDSVASCNRSFCILLAVALRSGCIVLWKVDLPAESERNFHVVRILDFGYSLPSELLFISVNDSLAYLCQGNRNGTVVLHPIRLKMTDHLTDQMSDQPVEIWSDVDKMSITGLTWSSNKNILLATKGQTVLMWRLDQLDTFHPVVSFVKSPAVSFEYSVHEIQLRVNEIFLSGQDGQIYQTSLDDLDSKCSSDGFLPLQSIDCPWNSRDWRINGLALSANGVFLFAAISPASYFCHLTLRKPSKIHWLCIKPVEEISRIVLYHTGSLQEVGDALSYLKWDWSVRHQWTENIMWLLSNQDSWSTYTTYQLRIVRLLLQIQIMYWKEDLDQNGKETLEENLSTIEEMIIRRHVQQSFDQILDHDARKSITVKESNLLAVMISFLKQKSLSADDSNRIKRICKKFKQKSELCGICKSHILYDGFQKASCEMGHTFSRCCQTLLLCQEVPYRVCSFCKAFALSKDSNGCFRSTHFTLQSNECTYCDGKLI